MDKKERKVKKQKKEQVKEAELKEKQSKVNFDKKKKLLILILVIVLFVIIGITIFFVLRNDDEYKLVDVDPTISTLEDGTYYIFGSPNNQSFEVETKDNFTYKVVDEENSEVKVSIAKKDNKVVINAPEQLYEDGKTYTLTITNGTFTKEELKETSVVSFSIVRKSKQTSELNKNVKSSSSSTNKVNKIGDKITLTSKEKYKTGDIILIDNEKAYKVENAEDGKYQLSIPTIEEIYKEFDYYGSAYLNLSEFEENEEIEKYLVAYVEKTIIDKIIPKVNAASKVEVDYKWDKKINGLVATIHAETDPGDKIFDKSFLKHHKLSFDYEVVIKIKANYDIFFDKYDINFTLEISNTPSFKLETESETLDKMKEGLKAYTAGENVLKLLQSDYKAVEKDTKKLKQTVGTIVTPTPVPGLNVIVDIGLIMEADLKANMNATLTNTNTITIGLNNKKGLYGNLKYKNKIEASAFGEASMRLGSQVDLGASLLGIVELSGGVKGGIYGKTTLDIKSEISDDKLSANLLSTTKAGLFSTIVVGAKVFGIEETATIYDGEVELYSYDLPLSSEGERTETVSKEEATTESEPNNNSSGNNDNTPTTKPEEKYYTVSIYSYGCGLPYSVQFIEAVKVKEGTALSSYKDSYGEYFNTNNGYAAWTIYSVAMQYISQAKKNEETYRACMDMCDAADNWNACWEKCKAPYGGKEPSNYGVLGSGNYNINSPINSDLELVRNTLGCGSN